MNQAYLTILACVARADGVIAPREREVLRRALASVDDLRVREQLDAIVDMSKHVELDQLLARAVLEVTLPQDHPATRAACIAELLRDCYIVAAVDGEISSAEVAVIEQVLAVASIPAQKRSTLHQWGECAARQMLDGAALALETISTPA